MRQVAYYYTPDRKVLIKDKEGKIILDRTYDTDNNVFQIPFQEIQTTNRLRMINKRPINTGLLDHFFEIYPPERDYKPKDISFNPSKTETNKACIYPALGKVFYNRKFLNDLNTIVDKKQVLFHEVGHLYYKSEWKCDLFAATVLFMFGYPPYSIAKAAAETLGYNDRNVDRIQSLISYLTYIDNGKRR